MQNGSFLVNKRERKYLFIRKEGFIIVNLFFMYYIIQIMKAIGR